MLYLPAVDLVNRRTRGRGGDRSKKGVPEKGNQWRQNGGFCAALGIGAIEVIEYEGNQGC